MSECFTLKEKREQLKKIGVPQWRIDELYPLPVESAPEREMRLEALEKEHEDQGDKLLVALGFEVLRYSHPGATKQTAGIPDRRYYRRPRIVDSGGGRFLVPAISFWWEAKSPEGRQTPAQAEFQQLVEACDETYFLGTYQQLVAQLIDAGICVRVDGNIVMAPNFAGQDARGAR